MFIRRGNSKVKIRGIYSDQFAELGKGKKNLPLKKEGEKISQKTTFRREKEGKKQEKGGKQPL